MSTRAIERAKRAKQEKDEQAEAERVAELAAQLVREEVRTMRKEMDDMRSRIHELSERPGDPRIIPRLISRDVVAEGEALRIEHVNLSARLQRLRRERREIDQRYERIRYEIRQGGVFRDGSHRHPQEDELRDQLRALNAELVERSDEIAEIEADLDELERELRGFVRVDSLPIRLTRDVHEQE